MRCEQNFTEYILSKFTKGVPNGSGAEQLIIRYQSLSIIYINFFFLAILVTWKVLGFIFPKLPGDEVIIVLTPIQIASLILMKKGKRDLSALFLLIAIHAGNFISSKICNVALGAAYLVIILPGLAYFVSSSKKIYFANLILCLVQNIGHIYKINRIFKVTFTDDQEFQIFTLSIISFMYIPLSWMLFALQKSIETQLWQVAHSNYEKAENITKELIEAVESKDRVVSSFSHEIRNPLNSLNGSIDYLLNIIKDSQHVKVLSNARLSGEVLLNLVNNILDAAKLKAEKMEIACTETNPIDILKKVLNINAEALIKRKITAKAYVDKRMPFQLYIDSSRLLQVIMNLFSNAIKFVTEKGKIDIYMQWCNEETPREELLRSFPIKNSQKGSGGIFEEFERVERLTFGSIHSQNNTKHSSLDSQACNTEEFEENDFLQYSRNLSYLQKVQKKHGLDSVRLHNSWLVERFNPIDVEDSSLATEEAKSHQSANQSRKGFLKVQISDSGCGIAKENIPKLFNMFSQVGARGHHEGTGLGLWICKQLCQKMGGDIAIHSKVNFGTSIIFYIEVNNHMLSSAPLSILKPIFDDKVRALVVDDFAYNRDVHKLILEREGVEVTLACDGKEAFEKYTGQSEGYFSFIMMDIQMPIMDGITSAQQIRKFEIENNRKEIDIYFVSGNYYSKTEALGSVNSIGSGSNLLNTQFLRKPIDVEIVKKISNKYNSLLKSKF